MSKRDSLLLVQDILESAQKIIRYTSGLDYETIFDELKDGYST